MPTYTNDSTETKIVEDIDGVLQHILPEGSIATYQILGVGWTETAATPVFNPVLSSTLVTLDTTGVVVTLGAKCTSIAVTEISGTVTAIHTDAVSIVPPLFANIPSTVNSTPTIDITPFRKFIRRVVCTGTGTCKIVQYQV